MNIKHKLCRYLITSFTVFWVILIAISNAEVIRIPEDNNSIQDAIDESEQGDTLLIAPGEYDVSLEIEDHGLTLASEYLFDDDSTIIEETILSGGNNFTVLTIDSLGADTVNIIGLTIANGMNLHPVDTGAGIVCLGARINLTNNIIRDNYASYTAGINLRNCTGTIINNRIVDNTATSSIGGLKAGHCNLFIEGNSFIGNTAGFHSGGMYGYSGSLNIRDNLFELNSSPIGGGLYLAFGHHQIENNVFRQNSAPTDEGTGGGLSVRGSNRRDEYMGNVVIRNNIFFENSSGSMGGGLNVTTFFISLDIYNNVFEDNNALSGGAIFIRAGCHLHKNIFRNNHSPQGSIIASGSSNGSNPTIYCYENTFIDNYPEDDLYPYYAAISTTSLSAIYVSRCDFMGNLPAAVGFNRVTNLGTITALNCYWGDPSGPYHPIENEEGLGDSVDSDMDEEDFIPFSRQPISASFKLAVPDSGAERNEIPVHFSWFPSVDYLTGDSIIYYSLEIFNSINDLDSLSFEGADQHNAGTDTFITIEVEDFERLYYWRVIAQGDNMPPTISIDTSMFILSDGLAPNPFDLGEPENFEISDEAPVLFTWAKTTDPTPDDTIRYTLEIATNDTFDSSMVYPVNSDTFITVDEFNFDNAYYWRVYAEDRFHHRTYSNESREFHFNRAKERDLDGIPADWEIVGIYPNPFNSSLTVTVGLPQRNDLRISIYDLLGREVRTLLDQTVNPGYRQFSFDARGMASGIYFLKINAPGKFDKMRKIVLVK